MKTIAVTEFKAKCLHLLDEVQQTGEEILVLKRGKPVARVVAERAGKPWLALRGSGAYTADPFTPAIGENHIQALK
jgi:prevent-host-death family protein